MTENTTAVIREGSSKSIIPENDTIGSSKSIIPENDTICLIQDSDSTSLIPENDSSTLVIPENAEPKGSHIRRYSTGDIAIPYTRVKILSRYLASSTGSCHDYCKYGIKHDSENQGRDMKKTVTLAVRQRTFPSPGSKRQNYSVPVVSGRKVSLSTKKEIVLSKQLSLPLKIRTDAGEKKKVVPPTRPSSIKKVLMRPIVSVFPKRSVKGVPQLKGQNEVLKAEYEQPVCQDVSQKTLHIIEIDTDENKNMKIPQIGTLPAGLSAPPAKKIVRSTKKGLHATQLPSSSEKKCVMHLKDGPTRISRTPISSLASSKSSHSSASCECHETDLKNSASNKLPSKTRPRKGGVICTIDKDSAARKVYFRSGKVVELQHEMRTSRRLKFRSRAPSDGQSDEVDTRKKNLKNKELCEGEANIVKLESEKVVLKHQDVQGRKVVQSLLNNLIEETAGKLVESRKGKVKALVGAFETVISLQDSKTSSTVDAC